MTIDHNHKKIYLYFQMSPPEWLLTWRVWPYRQCWQFLSPGQGPGRRQWPLPSHHSQWTVCNWRARYPVFKTNKRLSNHLHKERWNLVSSRVLMPRLNVFEKFLFRFDKDMEVPFVKKYYTSLTEQWRNEMRFQVSFCNKLQAERHNINVVSAINSNIYINSNIIVYKGVISLPTALFFLWIRYTLG